MDSWQPLLDALSRRIVPTPVGYALAAFLAVGLLELAWVGWRASSFGRLLAAGASARADLMVFGLVSAGLLRWIGVAASFGLFYLAAKGVHVLVPSLVVIDAPLPVQWLVFLLVTDLGTYWYHRSAHAIPALWEVHKFHHAAEEFTLLSGERFHPLDQGLQFLLISVPITLLGGRPGDALFTFVFYRFHTFLTHSNLPWAFGAGLQKVLVSPRGHLLHHALEPRYHDRNFGSVFAWWDHAFGTWLAPPAEDIALGVAGYPYRSALGGLWGCSVDFWCQVLVSSSRRIPGTRWMSSPRARS